MPISNFNSAHYVIFYFEIVLCTYLRTTPFSLHHLRTHILLLKKILGTPTYIGCLITVFLNVSNLMQNILKVTKYLQAKHKLENLSDDNCLVVIPTTDGKPWLDNSIEHGGGVWRMFNYIPNSTCFAIAPNGSILTEAGKAFERFYRCLSNYPNPSELHETIPNFHNTPARLQTFCKAVPENKVQRLLPIKEEVLFVENRASSLN